ncbi:hypothetical protein [Sphingosinicella sp. BN140058]|uniref:hypothetical protein n=1 Tax=Sphingosinicella sp. BN140058 TaxID=1892855 RepID=UPI001010AAE4|nr:hypothetical protein [Sphingosinicella sp. BN140058]QAY80174.1 hypothetical protein ETR14_26385 [Sphingosinicella sp. BN140058]
MDLVTTITMPQLAWAPAPCPTCGATSTSDAEQLCRATSDQSGEFSCLGDRADTDGLLLQPVQASLDAFDAWIDLHARAG